MKVRTVAVVSALISALALALAGVAGAMALAGTGQHSQRGSVVLTGSPSLPVANPKTHTLYVTIQCDHANSCPGTPTGSTLDIIDTSRCNAIVVSRCHVIGTTKVGKGPLDAVIDEKTDTIYVIDGLGAVSVLNGAKCNASVRTHCGVLATIRTGGFDVAGALDQKTHTLYVAAPSGDVFVINVAKCNSIITRGCHQHVRKVKDPFTPQGIDVDLATNTIYAANGGNNGNGQTVSVINGAKCNGSTGKGCAQTSRTINVGSNPLAVAVDQATNTVYVSNNNDNTVSVIDGAHCNGRVTSGCHRRPPTVNTGGSPAWVAVDQSRHTLFVMNEGDDTISEINTRTCDGHDHSGCPVRARNERARFNPPQGSNPAAFALVPGTGTVYALNPGGERFLAAISIKRCNALTTAGCRVEAPTVPLAAAFPVADHATDTIYASLKNKAGIEVLGGATCNAHTRSNCHGLATIPFPDPQANLGAIDHTTHTLYASDPFGNAVYVIDVQHCNAHEVSGCSTTPHKISVGPGPSIPVLDPITHTLYVDEGADHSNQIAVVDASTCNAQNSSGCGQTPATIHVGLNTFALNVDPSTDTVYAPVLGANGVNNTVWVINGASCNSADHSGCASAVVAKAKVGFGPSAVIVDGATHSVYVANSANGNLPGTVSVINSVKCNATHTAGCSKPAASITVGRNPQIMALDHSNQRIYVADISQAAVSIIAASRCNAGHPSGCHGMAREQPVASEPFVPLVNQGTVYVANAGPAAAWSIFPAAP